MWWRSSPCSTGGPGTGTGLGAALPGGGPAESGAVGCPAGPVPAPAAGPASAVAADTQSTGRRAQVRRNMGIRGGKNVLPSGNRCQNDPTLRRCSSVQPAAVRAAGNGAGLPPDARLRLARSLACPLRLFARPGLARRRGRRTPRMDQARPAPARWQAGEGAKTRREQRVGRDVLLGSSRIIRVSAGPARPPTRTASGRPTGTGRGTVYHSASRCRTACFLRVAATGTARCSREAPSFPGMSCRRVGQADPPVTRYGPVHGDRWPVPWCCPSPLAGWPPGPSMRTRAPGRAVAHA